MRRSVTRFRGFEPFANYLGVGAFLVVLTGCLVSSLRVAPDNPGALVFSAVTLVCIGLSLRMLRRGTVTLGSDGMAFAGLRPRGLPSFVPWSEVDSLHEVSTGFPSGDWGPIRLELTGGRSVHLPRVWDPSRFKAEARAALAAHRARPEVPVPVALTRAGGDYRAGALTREQLIAVVSEPRIAPKLRIEAAERARVSGDREALAELAEQVAQPEVRRRLAKLTRG